MAIGDLNERIEFSKKNYIPNGVGGTKINAANPKSVIGSIWAKVEVLNSQEVIKYGGNRLEANTRIEIRKNPDIKTDHIITWKGLDLEIEEKTPHTKKPGYELIYARELV